MHIVLVSICGVTGVLLRYAIDTQWAQQSNDVFKATFVVNILGCIVAALIYEFSQRRALFSPNVSQALMIGFCGGFTTFSAYALQTYSLLESKKFPMALAYCVASPVAGVVAIACTIALSRALFAKAVF